MRKLLCIGKVWPEPASSAAGRRMMKLLDLFHQHEWEVIFASVSNPSEFSVQLSELKFSSVSIELNNTSFDEFIKLQMPDVVVFDRFTSEEQFGWRVAKHCPGTLRILDTEDLHGVREARRLALIEGREFSENDLHIDVCKREIASIYRCDLSLIISEYEMQLLTSWFKIDAALLFYLPFYSDRISDEKKNKWPAFKSRTHFISIGNFLHAPNADAVTYLERDIWPRIRKQLPDAELHVYGAYAPEKLLRTSNLKSGFIIKGRAADSSLEMENHRVCLAPLRFGAGLKGKLLEAMQCGTPSVATRIGSEAMHGTLPFGGCIEDDPAKFAEAAVKLYKDEKTWEEKQFAGVEIIDQIFCNNHHEKLLQRIDDLIKDMEQHRSSNFTGAMMMHHTLQSTRYMALWIEEKNKSAEEWKKENS